MNTIEDIEIYVKNLPMEGIKEWLSHSFKTVTTITSGSVVHDLEVSNGSHNIQVMVVERAVGKAWTSIWFKTGGTPWQDDTQCALSIQQHSQCRVRCNSGPWQEGADMDEWWQVDETGTTTLLKWPTAQ